MYHGNGFTHHDVYTMPVYLRNFYIKELIDIKKQEKESVQKQKTTIPPQNTRFK